jgi:hypothetical protein
MLLTMKYIIYLTHFRMTITDLLISLNILLLATLANAQRLPSPSASKPALASPVVKPEVLKSTPSRIDEFNEFITKNNIDINTKLFGFSNNESPLVIEVDSFNGEGIYAGLTYLNNLRVNVSIESAPTYIEHYGSSIFYVTGKVARRKTEFSFYGIVSQLDKESSWYLFLESTVVWSASSFDNTIFKTPSVSTRNLLSSYSQCINACTDKNLLDQKTCSLTYITCVRRAVGGTQKCADAYNMCLAKASINRRNCNLKCESQTEKPSAKPSRKPSANPSHRPSTKQFLQNLMYTNSGLSFTLNFNTGKRPSTLQLLSQDCTANIFALPYPVFTYKSPVVQIINDKNQSVTYAVRCNITSLLRSNIYDQSYSTNSTIIARFCARVDLLDSSNQSVSFFKNPLMLVLNITKSLNFSVTNISVSETADVTFGQISVGSESDAAISNFFVTNTSVSETVQDSVELDTALSSLGGVTERNVVLGAMAFVAAIVMLAVAAKYK